MMGSGHRPHDRQPESEAAATADPIAAQPAERLEPVDELLVPFVDLEQRLAELLRVRRAPERVIATSTSARLSASGVRSSCEALATNRR